MQEFNLAHFVMTISALILAITVHEWAHAITADKLGDDTPRSQGRVTLWPLAHLDPLGTILMIVTTIVGVGFGWGRPVLTNPLNYKINPRIADSLVSVAGPLSNLFLAAFFAFLLRLGVIGDEAFVVWTERIILINIVLLLFNLLPIYPLDGSHLFANALPVPMAERYRLFMTQFGFFLFLAVMMSGVTTTILMPAVRSVYIFLVHSGT